MASSINASTSGAGGVITTADSSGVLNIQTAGNTAVTVDASQNVGIGTASPLAGDKLTISGGYGTFLSGASGTEASLSVGRTTTDLTLGVAAAAANYFSGSVAGDAAIAFGSGNLLFGSGNINTAGTERMRITSTGNVGIGNDNPTGFNNAFTAITTGSYLPLFVGHLNTSATGPGIIVAKWLNSNATSNVLMQFLINGVATGSGQINANGASAAAFGSYSDARLKENIEPLPSQLDNILALKPSEFDYKDGSGHQIGFIAQEMQEVYPDVVSEGENDMLTITGWSKTEARLVKAIQEQQTIINDLKARITALEGAA
jgi:hypothetical protein